MDSHQHGRTGPFLSGEGGVSDRLQASPPGSTEMPRPDDFF